MRQSSLMAAAMLYTLAAGVAVPGSPSTPCAKAAPGRFTAVRKAEAEAKRERKNAKRAAAARRGVR